MGKLEPYQELEARYSHYLRGSHPYTVACSSGTAALHLGLEALGLRQGGVVAVPEFTMIACARAVTLAGLKPLFVDCETNLTMRAKLLHSPWFDAVMAVHIYGRLCDMGPIHGASDGKPVIEDMAEAHGHLPHPSTDVACWSFYKNKIVAGEEGGMVAFRSKEHAERARSLRSLGFTAQHNFLHVPRGHNYRMSNLHAAPILDSFDNQRGNIHNRFRVIRLYDLMIPFEWQMPARNAPWVYDLGLPAGVDNELVVQKMHELGFPGARVGFKCMSEQPEYQSLGNPAYRETTAYEVSRRVMYLSISPATTYDQVRSTVDALRQIVTSLQ